MRAPFLEQSTAGGEAPTPGELRSAVAVIFYKGKVSKVDTAEIKIAEQLKEKVTEFKYLGMWLTPQLRFTNHIKKMVNKIRGKVGYILWKLNISFLCMKVLLQVFNCYIPQNIAYGLAIWWSEVSVGGL